MQTKISMSTILERAKNGRIQRYELEGDFEGLNAIQLEIVAKTLYITRNAQELLAKPGRYEGIYNQLVNNPTVFPGIKRKLREVVPQPVKIFTVVREEKIPKLQRK